MSSDNPYQSDPNQPPIPRPSGNNSLWIVGIVLACVAVPVMLFCVVGIAAGLLLPAVQSAREAARRMQCSNNLRQISLALHNYQDAYNTFPPAYTVDAAGNRLHSWRTLILPFIGQVELYEQIDLNKPWDDPTNLYLTETNVSAYRCPSIPLAPGDTTYLAVVDPSGVFSGPQGTRFSQILDGTPNTLLITEVDPASAVSWMSPQDLDRPTYTTAGQTSMHRGGCNCSMADGSVRFVQDDLDSAARDAMVTKDGGD